jgi:hypothetical protein
MMNRLQNMLSDSNFWDRKVRIAVLTIATFIAMC